MVSFSLTLEYVLTAGASIAVFVFGYLVRKLESQINRATNICAANKDETFKRLDSIDDDITKTRHDLRNEMNKVALREEMRRIEAIKEVEQRANKQLEQVVKQIDSNHHDIKEDVRTLNENLRELLKR